MKIKITLIVALFSLIAASCSPVVEPGDPQIANPIQKNEKAENPVE